MLWIIPAIIYAEADIGVSDQRTDSSEPGVGVDSEAAEQSRKFSFLRKKPENLLLVPIPMSSPTFGTGLILGGAYFYRQTEEQKNTQPASFTGAAVGYTSSDSWVAGVMQQNHWREDTWRFTGFAGYADLKLELNPALIEDNDQNSVNWLVNGPIFQARLSRKIIGDWYLGVTGRYLKISQSIDRNIEDPDFNLLSEITAPGIGLNLEFDTRDMPYNPYRGRHFELRAMTSNPSESDDGFYQSYHARITSYHSLADPLVLAWEVNGCTKSGRIPLWDTCRLGLRGFSGTDYLSKQSLYAQAELRWRFYKKWGVVAFAGAGRVDDSLGEQGEGETIPSYGVGLRLMLLESQRINLRIDYARSDKGNEAWYLSVTEAF